MKALVVMFDSLNRRMLPPYGNDWVYAPNFRRLAEQSLVFDSFFVGSLPCMPARRDLHTGRYNFLHRSWGPLEPFDNSMPEILHRNGVYSHLVSDHGHYWEDGGATYHNRYSSWECVRGQEADPWVGSVAEPCIPEHVPTMREFTHPEWWRNSWLNKEVIHSTGQWPQNDVFDKGLAFLARNKNEDNWFLQIETFDPHEPFDCPDEFFAHYDDDYEGPHFDWPPYAPVGETPEVVEHCRARYAALLSMCDRNLGRILDFLDKNDMWKDTLVIVNTDHGFMLGEKDWWAKSTMPCYNEVANTPFFLWDPRTQRKNERSAALGQNIDVPATLLSYFGIDPPAEMLGRPLGGEGRRYALFGNHGSFVNITDGRYVYMRASASLSNTPLNEYTLFPTRQQGFMELSQFAEMESAPAFSFTKGCRLMKLRCESRLGNATFCNSFQYGNLLFDLSSDPEQEHPLDDPALEARFINALIAEMQLCETPLEQFERLGLDSCRVYEAEDVRRDRLLRPSFASFPVTAGREWSEEAKHIFVGMLGLLPEERVAEYFDAVRGTLDELEDGRVERKHMAEVAKKFYSKDEGKLFYFLNKLSRIR